MTRPVAGWRTLVFWSQGSARALGRAWLLAALLTLVLGLVRGAQLLWYWPQALAWSTPEVGRVLVQGLRFDLKVSAIAAFLLLPLLAWVPARWLGRIAGLLALAWALLAIINLHYYGFYKTPIDALVFGLAEDDTVAVLRTVWLDFPVLRSLLAVALLGFAARALHTVLAAHLHAWLARPARPWRTLAGAALALLALMLAGKGTLREMALQRQHLTVTASPFLNDMVPNGVIALKYAWDSRRQSQNLHDVTLGLRSMGFASARAAADVLGLPAGDDAALLAALRSHPPLADGTPRKHLLFFLMESWSAEPLRYQSAQFDVLGRMAPTLAQACHFRNFDSAQPGTHPSLEALLFATPLTPLTLGPTGRRPIPWSVARVLQQAGYRTLFLTSARSGWRDLNRVLAAQGFDEVVDAATLQTLFPEAELGIWGVWDSYLFRYLQQRLANAPPQQPLFVFVLTSTNHPPYDLPADYPRVPRDMALWKGETHADTALNLDSYHYAADLLGAFVQRLQGNALWSRTVVAASGDHNVRSFGLYATPERRHLLRQVPFVIWGQDLACGSQQALPASHRDVFDTLLPLVGVQGPYVRAGRNLLQTPSGSALEAPRALFFTGEARNAQGVWQLGRPETWMCTPTASPSLPCAFNATDDLHERARYGLLDWHVRISLRK